jgi:hypothetical protein
MRKVKQTLVSPFVSFVSVSDIALNHARADKLIGDYAGLAIDHIKGFPVIKDMSENDVQSLKDGYALAHREHFVADTFAVINGHYVLATPEHIENDKVEKITMSLDYCMSFTTNQMGTDFKDRPQLKEIISKVRKGHQTYISNKLAKLIAKGNEILKERSGIKTKREKIDFEISVTNAFDALIKSVKVKQKNGDATANPVKFLSAVEAFWKAYRA